MRYRKEIHNRSRRIGATRPSSVSAYTIERRRKNYYTALERNNKELEITDWLAYFARTVLEAQGNTIRRVDFYIAKAKFMTPRGGLERAPGKSHRPDVKGRHRRLQGRPVRRELHQHCQDFTRYGDARPHQKGRAHPYRSASCGTRATSSILRLRHSRSPDASAFPIPFAPEWL